MGVKVREKVTGSGVWWVYVYHNRRRTAKKIGDKRTANKFARAMRERLAQGTVPAPREDAPTLEQYYRRFERSYLASAVKPTTRESYESSFSVHILPELGKLPLDEITRERLETFIGLLVKKGLAKDTIRLILAALGVLFREAVEHGVTDANPALRLGKFYRNAPTRHAEIQPLTPAEVPKFLGAVLKHAPEHFALFLTALHTGMRSGELAALQWGDVDFNGHFLTVRRNFVSGRVTTTKTEKIRRVDMSDALAQALKDLKRRRQAEWLEKGENVIPEWVFCNEAGNPPDMHNLKQRHFKRCLKKAELRKIRFHDVRHTYATLLIQQGESLAYVKDQLGHSTIKMTVDTYTHWIPGNREAVNRLPTLVSGAEKTGPKTAPIRHQAQNEAENSSPMAAASS